MPHFTRVIGAIFITASSINSFAADIPQEDIQAGEFNQEQCVDNNTQNCIDAQCLNSDQTDCQEQCAALAQSKCEQQVDD